MRKPSETWKRILILCVSPIVIAVVVLAMKWQPARAAASGFTRPMTAATGTIDNSISAVKETIFKSEEEQEAAQLKETIAKLETRILELKNAARENRQLRKQLLLPPTPGWNHITAKVIARDPLSWNIRFRINRGQKDGLSEGNAVLHEGNLIGRITELNYSSAIVTTVGSPDCRFSIRVAETDAVGVGGGFKSLKWYESPFIEATWLPRDKAYEYGRGVFTSGLGEEVPAGIQIGTITYRDVDRKQTTKIVDAAYAEILIRPSADIQDLRYVSVLSRRRTRNEVSQ